jgi:hypothetical protein
VKEAYRFGVSAFPQGDLPARYDLDAVGIACTSRP